MLRSVLDRSAKKFFRPIDSGTKRNSSTCSLLSAYGFQRVLPLPVLIVLVFTAAPATLPDRAAAEETTVCAVVEARDFEELQRLIETHKRAEEEDDDFLEALREAQRTANTVLHVAAGRGDIEMAEFALKLGADINDDGDFLACVCSPEVQDNPFHCDGVPPLHRTLLPVYPDMMEFLLEKGADPNSRVPFGGTILHQLAKHSLYPGERGSAMGDSDFVAAMRLVLKYGADPNRKDHADRIPLHMLGWERAGEKAVALLEAGADPNALDLSRRPLDYLLGFIKAAIVICKAGGQSSWEGAQSCDFRRVGPESSGDRLEKPSGEEQ